MFQIVQAAAAQNAYTQRPDRVSFADGWIVVLKFDIPGTYNQTLHLRDLIINHNLTTTHNGNKIHPLCQ